MITCDKCNRSFSSPGPVTVGGTYRNDEGSARFVWNNGNLETREATCKDCENKAYEAKTHLRNPHPPPPRSPLASGLGALEVSL